MSSARPPPAKRPPANHDIPLEPVSRDEARHKGKGKGNEGRGHEKAVAGTRTGTTTGTAGGAIGTTVAGMTMSW